MVLTFTVSEEEIKNFSRIVSAEIVHRQFTSSVTHHCTTNDKIYSKTYVKRPLKNRQNKGLNDKW